MIIQCAHCSHDAVIDEDDSIAEAVVHNSNGNVRHGVVPLWIWSFNESQFIRNTEYDALCLDCANKIIK